KLFDEANALQAQLADGRQKKNNNEDIAGQIEPLLAALRNDNNKRNNDQQQQFPQQATPPVASNNQTPPQDQNLNHTPPPAEQQTPPVPPVMLSQANVSIPQGDRTIQLPSITYGNSALTAGRNQSDANMMALDDPMIKAALQSGNPLFLGIARAQLAGAK